MSGVISNLQVTPVWAAMMRGARRFVEDNGFMAVHGLPAVAGASGSCENFSAVFEVKGSEDFFGKKAFLVQSGQLYLEGFTPEYRKVYTEIQSFRKEPDVDDRHLAQFTLFEIEHIGGLDELMDNIEGVVKSAVSEAIPAVERLSPGRVEVLQNFVDTPMPRITYREALEMLEPHFPDLMFGDDLKANHEAKIVELAGGAVLNTHHPAGIKFFSMAEQSDDRTVVKSCDLLLPFAGESAGAAERVVDYDDLVRKLHTSDMYHLMRAEGVKDEEFDWYLDQHKSGDIEVHSGAGIGMARVAQFILGVEDIRDAVPFVVNKDTLL